MDSFSNQLRDEAVDLWSALPLHPFIKEMATGELPIGKFRFYIDQNLLYLPDYARTLAIGIQVSQSAAELKWFTDAVDNIVSVEIPENIELQSRISQLGGEPHHAAAVMAPATLAYTSYLLATAARSDALGILSLILPCAWSYQEIALAHVQDSAHHPVYAEWLRFFSTEEYKSVVDQLCKSVDDLAEASSPSQLLSANEVFRAGLRLELAFWDMAYAEDHWPDLNPRNKGAS